MCLQPEKFTSLEVVQDLAVNTVRREGSTGGVGAHGKMWCWGAGGLCPVPEVAQTKSPGKGHPDGGCGALPVAPGCPWGWVVAALQELHTDVLTSQQCDSLLDLSSC